jgi:hypothetical protein
MNVKELAWHAEIHQFRHECTLLKMLDSLRGIDPKVAERAVYVFDDQTDAAHWLTKPVLTLGGITPLQALAEGRREDVLWVLNEIFYGLPE